MTINFLVTKVLPADCKGDLAIAESMLEAITKLYPEAKISILCRNASKDKKIFSEYGNVYRELFSIEGRKICRFFLAVEFISKFLLYLVWIRFKNVPIDDHAKTIFSLYEKSDLIINCGGNSLGGGTFGLMLNSFITIFLAQKFKKKIYISGLTIEPPRRFFKTLTRFILNRVDLITTREPLSLGVLETLKIKTRKCLTADYALLLGSESLDFGHELLRKVGVPKNNKIRIGINLAEWNFHFIDAANLQSTPKRIIPYRDEMVNAIEIILTKLDAVIVFFPTNISPKTDDRILFKSIKNSIKKSLAGRIFILTEDYMPKQIKSMIGTMDIFIGTRFHSTLFAISMCVPTISISHMQKNRGFMEMIGLKEWFLDYFTLTADQLVDATMKLLKERDKVTNIIRGRLPELRNNAMQNVELINELLYK